MVGGQGLGRGTVYSRSGMRQDGRASRPLAQDKRATKVALTGSLSRNMFTPMSKVARGLKQSWGRNKRYGSPMRTSAPASASAVRPSSMAVKLRRRQNPAPARTQAPPVHG